MGKNKKTIATIIKEIDYPVFHVRGIIIRASFKKDDVNVGRTVIIDDESPDGAIRCALNKFADEIKDLREKGDE